MAESPAHKFGQVIGSLVEAVVTPRLQSFCQEAGLYLDYQHRYRPARRGRKVSWKDQHGNSHDLDFVIERDGSDDVIGQPIAFIEVAWRRYTKHSRNKAQEIQGAVIPLAQTYNLNSPYLGTILVGEFTKASLDQLRSNGFHILHLPYESLVSAFEAVGIDVRFDERTPDEAFRACTRRIEDLSPQCMERVKQRLIEANCEAIESFFASLRLRLTRYITRVVVLPLYGQASEFSSIADALRFLGDHDTQTGSSTFLRYEVQVMFSNGDRLQGAFESRYAAREFLEFAVRG